ncbi:DUF5667 domain-containing protein [Aeribacillus pallidus]|uniref:DUF5667 domain-containing protein n=1 Tax=Aeribacillus pallidus TaxID=33936 RepID=UPI003D1AE51B
MKSLWKKSSLALVVAGTFAFSNVLVQAEGNGTTLANDGQQNESFDNFETIDISKMMEDAADVKDQLETSNPDLVPGDFFYFVKIALEKIQLALTFDQEKEAELIAKFAFERLAEAEKLMSEGNEEAALESLQVAMDLLKESESMVNEEDVEEDVDSEATDDTVEENEDEAEDDTTTIDEVQEKEDSDDASSAEEVEDTYDQVMRNNIIALTLAMEKVKNPKAKEALQKNILKTYQKMYKKYGYIIDIDIDVKEVQSDVNETPTAIDNPTEEQTVATDTVQEKVETKDVTEQVEGTTNAIVSTEKEKKAEKETGKAKMKEEVKVKVKEKKEEVIEKVNEKHREKEKRHDEKHEKHEKHKKHEKHEIMKEKKREKHEKDEHDDDDQKDERE